MHKSATKCNETIGKWCKNKHGASKIIDTFETYQGPYLIHEVIPGRAYRLRNPKQEQMRKTHGTLHSCVASTHRRIRPLFSFSCKQTPAAVRAQYYAFSIDQ
jgi:hypothetical protein